MMKINNPHLSDRKDKASGESSKQSDLSLFKGGCCYCDSVSHDIKSIRKTDAVKLFGPWFLEV